MGNSGQNRKADEIARLTTALEAETQRCLEIERQLNRANAEFEEFVSIAAHNLRESLRDVASFSQLMAETYADRLDASAGVFLDHIQNGASRMQSLLADVVDYWATRTGDRRCSQTDMEAVLRQALLYADEQITKRGAIVTHDPLPQVCGEVGLLAKILHHLIRNAVEYCGAAPPCVHISSMRRDPDWVFSVQDNGPGIDPEFQGSIFQAFRRLHGKEYPGNGLGLAFCKKAIGWHGGQMWMESEPGVGSTFYFTLPADD